MVAKKAKKMDRDIGMPGYRRFLGLLDRNYFRNYSKSSDDVKREIHVYRMDVAATKGKCKRKKQIPYNNSSTYPSQSQFDTNTP